MANKERGDVSFEADGTTYTLRYSIDALCHLEDAAGKGIVAVTQDFADPEKISLKLARAALWAGLQEQHPDLELKDAGELIPKVGGVIKVIQIVSEAIGAAFEKPKGPGRPPKAAS